MNKYVIWVPKAEDGVPKFPFLKRTESQSSVMYEVTKETYQEIKECQQSEKSCTSNPQKSQ